MPVMGLMCRTLLRTAYSSVTKIGRGVVARFTRDLLLPHPGVQRIQQGVVTGV